MKSICKPIIYSLLFVFCSKLSFSQVSVDRGIEAIMKEYETVGLAVVVVKNDDIVFEKSYGYKDLENQLLLANDDIFRIASISKSFTATALMQLVEKRFISLDDDVSALIGFEVRNPHYPKVPITLRMILSHTSSLNDSQGYFSLDNINPEQSESYQASYSDYQPGSTYKYCNLNYNLAGAILEKVSNRRFEECIIANILNPIGIYGGYDADLLDKSRFVKLYSYDSKEKSFVYSPSAYQSLGDQKKDYVIGYSAPLFSPTGGMKISARDLAKYMVMHMNKGSYNGKNILSEESSKLMQSPITKVSDQAQYGLGILLTKDFVKGKALIGHTGSAYGLFSAMFFDPVKKVGFIVITNGSKSKSDSGYDSLLSPITTLLYNTFVE